MKILILITARLGSTRLARKHLLPVKGKPILQFLVDTINLEFNKEILNRDIVLAIATSEKPENSEFETALSGCSVFYGSDENIPLRHLQAADYYQADAIISVDGDDILCSPRAMRSVFESLKDGSLIVKTEGLPLGMNASGYTSDVLRKSLIDYSLNSKLETGWGRIFTGVKTDLITINLDAPGNLRFTLDYEEDYKFFIKVLENEKIRMGLADDREVVDFVVANNLEKITQSLVEEYWRNFHAHIETEESGRKL